MFHDICVNDFKPVYDACAKHIKAACDKSTIRATKTIRLTMRDVEYLLGTDPTIRILHMLRDPRAIAHSRLKAGLMSPYVIRQHNTTSGRLVAEALMICHKMRKDIALRKVLELKYPHTFMQLQYEQIATHPLQQYREIYKFLGLRPSTVVEKWLKGNTNSTKDGGTYETNRRNSTETARQWQTDISYREALEIQEQCSDIIEMLVT